MPEEKNIPLPEIPAGGENYEQPINPESNREIKERETPGRTEQSEISLEEISITPGAGATAPVAASFDDEEVARHAEELKTHERPRQVEILARTAIEKGVPHAVAVAKKLDSYSLDALHDTLVDDLYAELKKKGLIKGL